ncbi:hypothetical protein [uncultured Psychroserpens sp.]|uniref:hypothetical protein n=1 Tax=uncultured Psychroserpens sp. TaxID=255436 RepID=UPI002636D5B0|nr:hypothetical protein [uncultured Psychroserpens sp.]
MEAIVVEDKPSDRKLIIDGLKKSKYNFEIIDVDIKEILSDLNTSDNVDKLVRKEDTKVQYVIDVNLTKAKGEEYGLKLLKKLKSRVDEDNCKFIIVSNWSKCDFTSDVDLEYDNFVDKRLFNGFEFKYKIKMEVNSLWAK